MTTTANSPSTSYVENFEDRLRLAHASLKQTLTRDYQLLVRRQDGLAPPVAIPAALQAESLLAEIRSKGRITQDWFTHNIPELYEGLILSGRSFASLLEIGSFEGLSTCWFARLVRHQSTRAGITAIDRFTASESSPWTEGYESRFDYNVAQLLAGRNLKKIKSDSASALAALLSEGRSYDLIYVDGSHVALDVLVDAALAWRLIQPGGVIVFDDYFWLSPDVPRSVLLGLNAFLDVIEGQYRPLKVYYQVVLQKIA